MLIYDHDESCHDHRVQAVRMRRAAHARALAAVNARKERRHVRQQWAILVAAAALVTVASVLWEGGWLDSKPNAFDLAAK